MKNQYYYVFLSLLFVVVNCIPANANLQLILDSISYKSTVYIPAKEYSSNNSMVLRNKKNITIIFEDSSKIICQDNQKDVFIIEDCENVTIVNGLYKHKALYGCDDGVFEITNSSQINLVNCDINGSGTIGVYMKSVDDINIINCNIHDNSDYGIFFDGENSNVFCINNRFENNGEDEDDYMVLGENSSVNDLHEIKLSSNIASNLMNLSDSIKKVFLGNHKLVKVENHNNVPSDLFKSSNNMYYFERTWNDPDLMGCKQKNLVQIRGKKAYILSYEFADALGGGYSFCVGTVNGNTINATVYSDHVENEDVGSIAVDSVKVIFKLTANRYILTSIIKVSDGNNAIDKTRYGTLVYDFYDGIRNIRSAPKIDAPIITKLDLSTQKVKLLEIGNVDRVDKSKFTVDFWYYIEVNGIKGWVYGGLILN